MVRARSKAKDRRALGSPAAQLGRNPPRPRSSSPAHAGRRVARPTPWVGAGGATFSAP